MQKVKVNWSRVKVNGYMARVGFGFLGWVTGRAVDPMTSSYDVSLTWTRAHVDVDRKSVV